jgi:hypothetical protein
MPDSRSHAKMISFADPRFSLGSFQSFIDKYGWKSDRPINQALKEGRAFSLHVVNNEPPPPPRPRTCWERILETD